MAKILTTYLDAGDAYPGTVTGAVLDFEGLGHGTAPVLVGLASAVFGVTSDGAGWAAPLASYWPISTADQTDRTADHETIGWWMEQADEVRAPIIRALGHGSRAGLATLRAAVLGTWDAAGKAGARMWWAKPAAYDLALWWALVRQHVSRTVKIAGKLRDARTLYDAAEMAAGANIREPRDLGPQHDPSVDALATAAACADAMSALIRARKSADATFCAPTGTFDDMPAVEPWPTD